MALLDGQVGLVTGAGRGQGRSHCVRLAEEGADVIAVDICGPLSDAIPYAMATPDELDETVRLVEAAGRRCLAFHADVRDIGALRAAADAGVAELGRLDVVIGVNLTGGWNTARATIPHLLAGGRGGSIVFISSAAGLRGHVPYAHYVASKHGLVGLTRALSNELAKHRIRVNSVHPTGVSGTGLSLSAPLEELVATEPLFGMGATNTLVEAVEPRDVSNAVVWLASDQARYVTGMQLTVDAGTTTKP